MNYWLLKSEPETYSFDQLMKDKKTNWDHVRNFQARNFLNQVKKGDLALIYHSGEDKAVVGLAEVEKEAYPDLDPDHKGDWVQIDIKPVQKAKTPVTLKEIKAEAKLKGLLLITHSRLSCMSVAPAHFKLLAKMAGLDV